MKKYLILLSFILGIFFNVAHTQTVAVTQVDTFAIRALPDQPVLKIVIDAGANTSLSLERLVVYSSSEDSMDISKVRLYRTSINSFSKSEYAEDAVPVTSLGSKFIKDSAVFSGLTYPLNEGQNIIWVIYDLSSNSKSGHFIDGFIKAGGITISGNKYPATTENPGGDILIRQKYFIENFEKRDPINHYPVNWTIKGDINADWKCEKGGFSGNPANPKSGSFNAFSYAENPSGRVSRMISKPLNLSLAIKPKMTFYHAQIFRDVTQKSDSLGLYYGFTSTGPWIFIKNYTLATPSGVWVKREIDLPDDAVKSNVYLVFKSTAQWGFGVCVDSVTIYEANVSERKIKSIICSHPNLSFVPQGSSNNPILRMNIGVTGNTGALNFSALKITAVNTSNNDVNNVKLYETSDSVFIKPVLLGSGTFAGGTVTFNGFSKRLESGDNYYWITYDAVANATPENILDGKIAIGDITISDGKVYPDVELSPAGNRVIKQSIFFDDFENNKGWIYSGEFERGQPLGKGGTSFGFNDPAFAFSQTNIIGTDLTVNGDYNKVSLDLATSPLIEAKYFKNTLMSYARWLNAENQDSAVIEYQYEGDTKWNILWDTYSTIIDGSWSVMSQSTKNLLDRKNFKIRFRLGKTNNLEEYSGWNIDDVFITGDSIKYDASLTEFLGPFSACGLTSGEQVKIRVQNTGPKVLSNIPVKVSVDGGKTWISEIISGNLAVNAITTHTFQPINLSKPAIYKVIVKVAYPGDNFPDNDSIVYNLMSVPTYSVPYCDGFEKDTTFWLTGGLNSSWVKGKPSGLGFSTAYEGANCWKTDAYSGYHAIYENSYMESPCFNLSDVEIPLVDMYFRHYTQIQKSGARMEYSLDGGATYNYVPKDAQTFPWTWYNDLVTAFHDNSKGWTGQSVYGTELAWINGKQLLPGATANKSQVRFRIHFKADSSVLIADPGFAFDKFKVMNAPQDAGVVSIDDLATPVCQYTNSDKLKVTIKNFGLRKIRQNDSIIIGVRINNNAVVKDTFKIGSDLNVNATLQLTMKKSVNMVNAGDYIIKAFVVDQYPMYYDNDNDTSTLNITVYPNPITNLADTIYTARRDTLIVKTINDPDYNYEWTFENNVVSTTNSVDANVTGFGDHFLKVENKISGCTTLDTVFVKSLIQDIGVQNIISPTSNCGYKTGAKPVIRIKNYGTDTLRQNQVIPVKIKLNKGTVLAENIILNKTLAPDSSYVATLSTVLQLMAAKTDTIKIWTALAADDSLKNDTTTTTFQIYGYPKIFLGNDTTIKGKLSYTLDAGSAYSSWSWNGGEEATQTFKVTKSGNYIVTVTDSKNCANSDTIHVNLLFHDLAMSKIVSPVNACSQTSNSIIKCQLKNSGTDTIRITEPVILYYQVNGGAISQDTLILTNMLKPNDSIEYAFKKKLNMVNVGSYAFKLKSSIVNDIQLGNDSILQNVEVYGNPVFSLGEDRIVQALTYSLNPGKFVSYRWQDNSVDSVWTITKTKYQQNNIYSVAVTDAHGCVAKDTVVLFLLINDLKVSDIIIPRSSCSMSNKETINLKITNDGNAPLNNKVVEVSYSLNGKPEVKETFTFNGAVGASMIHTFQSLQDMSVKGTYSFKAKVNMPSDVNVLNDTATYITKVLGYPIVNFDAPNDTFFVKLPYTLHAGAGYAEYLWQDNSFDSTFNITKENYDITHPLYSVIVTDVNGCSVPASVKVIESVYDLAVNSINLPAINCNLPAGKLETTIKNNSTVSLNNRSITLSYSTDGGTSVEKQMSVTLSKGASMIMVLDEDVDLSAIATHKIDVALTFADDEVLDNNSQSFEVKVLGTPTLELADTVKASTFPYRLDAGADYTSYKWNDNSTDRYLNVGAEGSYVVMVTDVNNCSSKDSTYVRNVTGTNSLKNVAEIKLFPNPVSDYLYVSIHLFKKQTIIMDMVNAEGKTVYGKKFENMDQYRDDIPVSGLPKGMYYVRFYSDDSMMVEKIVVR